MDCYVQVTVTSDNKGSVVFDLLREFRYKISSPLCYNIRPTKSRRTSHDHTG
jgi:hypothetical protein